MIGITAINASEPKTHEIKTGNSTASTAISLGLGALSTRSTRQTARNQFKIASKQYYDHRLGASLANKEGDRAALTGCTAK